MSVLINEETGKSKSEKVLFYVMGFFLFVMTFTIFLQVFFRYILNSSLSWTEELARFMQIGLTFVGVIYATKKGIHISLGDAITKKLPMRFQSIISVMVSLLTVTFFSVVVYHGYRIVNVVKVQTSASMGIPMSYIYAVIPISALLSIIFVITKNIIFRRG